MGDEACLKTFDLDSLQCEQPSLIPDGQPALLAAHPAAPVSQRSQASTPSWSPVRPRKYGYVLRCRSASPLKLNPTRSTLPHRPSRFELSPLIKTSSSPAHGHCGCVHSLRLGCPALLCVQRQIATQTHTQTPTSDHPDSCPLTPCTCLQRGSQRPPLLSPTCEARLTVASVNDDHIVRQRIAVVNSRSGLQASLSCTKGTRACMAWRSVMSAAATGLFTARLLLWPPLPLSLLLQVLAVVFAVLEQALTHRPR